MSITPTTYKFLNHQPRPAAPVQAPVAVGVASATEAAGQLSTSLETLLNAIRQEATQLQNNWKPQPAAPTAPAPIFTLPDLGSLLDRLLHPTPAPSAPQPAPKPIPIPVPTPSGGREPESRIIAEQPYSQNKSSAAQKELRAERKRQSHRAKISPGVLMGPGHHGEKRRIRDIAAHSAHEQSISAKGFHKTKDGYQGPTLHNPNTASGKFNPFTYQPTWVFDTKEDSFPVRPDFDGDGLGGNSDLKAYKHGVIGGKQPLEGGFTVTQKGEFTVQTYSLHYVDNKFTNYHVGDSSTVSIYLKKNAQGQLEPAYVYTSIHYSGTMTPWKDIKKDAQGRPIIRVERGSHALHPYGVKESVPKDGLQIGANGQATLNGKALPNRMTWLSSQQNIEGTRYLDPDKAAGRRVWGRYFSAYPERREPFHPSLFKL